LSPFPGDGGSSPAFNWSGKKRYRSLFFPPSRSNFFSLFLATQYSAGNCSPPKFLFSPYVRANERNSFLPPISLSLPHPPCVVVSFLFLSSPKTTVVLPPISFFQIFMENRLTTGSRYWVPFIFGPSPLLERYMGVLL